jgi:hypothetical protein
MNASCVWEMMTNRTIGKLQVILVSKGVLFVVVVVVVVVVVCFVCVRWLIYFYFKLVQKNKKQKNLIINNSYYGARASGTLTSDCSLAVGGNSDSIFFFDYIWFGLIKLLITYVYLGFNWFISVCGMFMIVE